jgi:glycosyltransferase involved in cell wall biosynthesis
VAADKVRVLQAVAYLSEDGAYGGPLSVAYDQCGALEASGTSVTLVAGWDGRAAIAGTVTPRRFRAWKLVRRSFSSLFSPGLLLWSARRIRRFDVVHVHFARDLMMLPLAAIALAGKRPVVLQTHGMVQPDQRRLVKALDRLITVRILRRARTVIALTEDEAAGLKQLGVRDEQLRIIGNGVPVSAVVARPATTSPLVIYASRLAPRKRPLAFVRAAHAVHAERTDVRFELWGPDGGELDAVKAEITALSLENACRYRGAVTSEQVRSLLAGAQVFVLPSVAEPFPIALLEAMSAGLPSVITSDTGISEQVGRAGAGIVTDGSPEAIAEAILGLVSDPVRWEHAAQAARRLVASDFSVDHVAGLLERAYADAVRKVA